MYDDRWRMVASFVDAAGTPNEAWLYHNAGLAGRGGSSYIDSVILRDRDNAGDTTLEERRVYCQNWRADVIAITRDDGTPWEYVRYSSYGEPTVYPVADVNRDGVVNSTDITDWNNLMGGGSSNAAVDKDLNRDGFEPDSADTDLFDESYTANVGLSGKGRLSLRDTTTSETSNRKGYAGYEWDQSIQAYHVRHRVYLPSIGRWSKRDPLGYIDGINLFQYCRSRPIAYRDPLGLSGDPVLSILQSTNDTATSLLMPFFANYFNNVSVAISITLNSAHIPYITPHIAGGIIVESTVIDESGVTSVPFSNPSNTHIGIIGDFELDTPTLGGAFVGAGASAPWQSNYKHDEREAFAFSGVSVGPIFGGAGMSVSNSGRDNRFSGANPYLFIGYEFDLGLVSFNPMIITSGNSTIKNITSITIIGVRYFLESILPDPCKSSQVPQTPMITNPVTRHPDPFSPAPRPMPWHPPLR